jgi:phosphatidylinositol-3-phosphatase
MKGQRRGGLRGSGRALALVLALVSAGSFMTLRAQGDCNDNPWAPGWAPAWHAIFQGIDWAGACTMRLPSAPDGTQQRMQKANIARIDLQAPGIQLFVTPKSGSTFETRGQLATEFVCDNGLQLAVNANFFSPCCSYDPDPPQPNQDNLLGLAVSQSQIVSSPAFCSSPDQATALLLAQDNRAVVQTVTSGTLPVGVFNAVSGGPLLLLNGVDQFDPATDANPPLVAPRTAAGLSPDGRYLYLLTIDGVEGQGRGAGFYDVAEWLLRIGAVNGFNLDGGGSTTMAMQRPDLGGAEILNSPREICVQRYVGALLGVRAKALAQPFLPSGCGVKSCSPSPPSRLTAAAAKTSWPVGLPVYDHIVVVVEENKDYNQIIGQAETPYINKLRQEGANFTAFYAEEHHSEGNYFWLLSGSDQNVGFQDVVPTSGNNADYPFTASNLAQQLIARGRTFKGYAESLPAIGSTTDGDGDYARKHVPWISFQNIPDGTTAATSANLRFEDFPASYDDLPTVSFVIPNLVHDMHSASICDGDNWLREHLDGYYQWAKTHNSLLIVTFDEDNDISNSAGLTDPASPDSAMRNRIATIFAGAHIKPGDYMEETGITHVNVLRTLEAMYGLGRSGAQQPYALKFGIPDDRIIADIFTVVP